ncbi:Os02g0673301, partial [Oryza sativa Japonica Group]
QDGRERAQVALKLVHGRVHVRHGEVQRLGAGHGGDRGGRLPENPRALRGQPRAHVAEQPLDVLGRLDLGADAAVERLDAVRAVAHRGAHLGVLRVRVAEAEPPVRRLPPRQVGLRVLRRLGVEHALVPLRLGRGGLRREVVLDAALDGAGELLHVAHREEVQLLAGPHRPDDDADGEADDDADADGGHPLLRQVQQLVDAVPRHGDEAERQDEDGHAVVEPRLHRWYEPREGGRRS